jgi:poly-gamma-glutamate capsule biosynthesis protein CapA/YwtB (metallophosphatase superfamily)
MSIGISKLKLLIETARNVAFDLIILFFLALAFSCRFGVNSSVGVGISPTNTEVKPTPSADSEVVITIAAVGDVMLGSPFPDDSRMPPNDGVDLLKPAESILKSADIAFGNLEGPLADGGVSAKCGRRKSRCFAFRMPTRYGRYLKEAGFDVLSLANNHAGDFGDAGRASTRKTLDELGIKHVGSDKEQYAWTILEVKGKKIGFIGFAHNNVSLNVNDLETAKRAVADLKKKVDIVVVSFHGGAEGAGSQRVPKQTEYFFGEARGNLPLFSRTVIDAGASLVLGHGPHVLRGMEIYKDRLIAYSLGNFVTYGWFRLEGPTAETMILEVKIDSQGKFLGGKVHPFKLEDRGILVKDDTKSAIYTVRRLSEMDFPETAPRIEDDGSIFPRR